MFTAVKGSKHQDHTAYRVVEYSYAEVSRTAYPTSGNLMWEQDKTSGSTYVALTPA